jgi:hypothetical protein
MDQDDELKRFKWLLFAGLLFLITGYFSYKELKYAIWGHSVDAQVTEIKKWVRTSRRSESPMIDLTYSYKEADGTGRSGMDSVNESWVQGDLTTVRIQYFAGVEGSSRIKASERLMPVYVFLAAVLWLAYSIFKLVREANTPIARGPGRRAR